jgi:hypothetical protein
MLIRPWVNVELAETKVNEENTFLTLGQTNTQVLWLDIAMHDVVLV